MIFEYTQYLRPDGRQVQHETEAPDHLQDKYDELHAAGCRLAAEVLQTGHVSLTIEAPADMGDVMIEVIPNGPGVPKAWERMIQGFDIAAFQEWMNDQESQDPSSGGLEELA